MGAMDYSFDTWLDTRLRDVPVPSGMLGRLREIPFAADTDLDAAVCDISVPSGLRKNLERIGRRHARLARLGQMTATASLAAAVAFSYLGAVLAFLLSAYRPPNAPAPRLRQLETITRAFSAFGQVADAEDQISLVTFQPFGKDVRSPGRNESPDAADPSLKIGIHPSPEGAAGGELGVVPRLRIAKGGWGIAERCPRKAPSWRFASLSRQPPQPTKPRLPLHLSSVGWHGGGAEADSCSRRKGKVVCGEFSDWPRRSGLG